MSRVIPGMGVATPLDELVTNYRRLASALPDILALFPTGRVVRNEVGNLSIVVQNGNEVEYVGFIDVRTGDVVILE